MSLTATFLQRASEDVNVKSSFRGLPIIIETPKGGVREGDLPDGTHWKKTMLCDYGYIPGTEAAGDKEDLDVYVGEDESSPWAFAIEQIDDDGEFDEYKVMLGFPDLLAAEETFYKMWGEEGRKNVADIWEIPLTQLFDGVKENIAENKTGSGVPKLIMQFLNSYDFEFYERVATEVHEFLEDMFRGAGIKALVTSRAKRTRSLRDKLVNRHNKNQYEDLAAIQQDIKDLAGVRVALYFPQDQEKVRAIIESNFQQARPVKEFPRDADAQDGQIYRALHYTVWYEGTVVEIQVASILMHALQEVNHDLGYKPNMGVLSEAEVQILEMLGALVGAGESSIDELQGEIERRTGSPLQSAVVAHLRNKFAAARYHLADDLPVMYQGEDPFKKEKTFRTESPSTPQAVTEGRGKTGKTRYQKLCERRGVTADAMDDQLREMFKQQGLVRSVGADDKYIQQALNEIAPGAKQVDEIISDLRHQVYERAQQLKEMDKRI